MQLNWEKFQNEYQKATPQIRVIIDGETIPHCVDTVILKNGLPPTLKKELVVSTINKIINLADDSEIYTFLTTKGLPMQQAAQVLGEIVTCSLSSLTTTTISTPINPEEIPPLRTMTSDRVQIGYQNSEEPVYTSIQSAILQEGK